VYLSFVQHISGTEKLGTRFKKQTLEISKTSQNIIVIPICVTTNKVESRIFQIWIVPVSENRIFRQINFSVQLLTILEW
jgi:hypothetical protein